MSDASSAGTSKIKKPVSRHSSTAGVGTSADTGEISDDIVSEMVPIDEVKSKLKKKFIRIFRLESWESNGLNIRSHPMGYVQDLKRGCVTIKPGSYNITYDEEFDEYTLGYVGTSIVFKTSKYIDVLEAFQSIGLTLMSDLYPLALGAVFAFAQPKMGHRWWILPVAMSVPNILIGMIHAGLFIALGRTPSVEMTFPRVTKSEYVSRALSLGKDKFSIEEGIKVEVEDDNVPRKSRKVRRYFNISHGIFTKINLYKLLMNSGNNLIRGAFIFTALALATTSSGGIKKTIVDLFTWQRK